MKYLKIGLFVAVLCLGFSSYAGDLYCSNIALSSDKSKCFYELGASSISSEKYKEAIEQLTAGIKTMGQNYNMDGRAIDDTGQKLTLAKIEEKRGNLEVSANLYKSVLGSRIQLAPDGAN